MWHVCPLSSSEEGGGAGDGEGAALGKTSACLLVLLFLGTFIFMWFHVNDPQGVE